ncbi:MAG: hypothetical protein V3R71_08700 [Gemmatimonadales bacterium]|jgi:hypothetical protein
MKPRSLWQALVGQLPHRARQRAALGYRMYRQTTFHRDIEGSGGVRYDMVDVWYRL